MPRLTSVTSGVTVSVSDETATRLGSEWVSESSRSETPDKSWKVAELKAYADENNIDLGDATRKDDILAAITTVDEESTADDKSDDNSGEES